MPEPFKNWIHPGIVARLADDVLGVYPSFDADGFRSMAAGLEPLELKARVTHVARALRHHLPAHWPDAARILGAILPPALDREDDFSGNVHVWPLTEVVAEFGLEHPVLSLDLLLEMTRRWSSEFAVRPFIVRWPDVANEVLDRWVTHPDLHVRRLVSEGSRPRLPWGIRLQDAVRSPERGLVRILRLVDDPSPYVRRSVANHLGDIAKDRPDLAVQAASSLLGQPSDDRLHLVRHGLRSLFKSGHPGALALIGADAAVIVSDVDVAPGAPIGGRLRVRARLSGAPGTKARVDLVWHWPGVRGWCCKTFRATTVTLSSSPSDVEVHLTLRTSSGRRLVAGTHRVTLRVNGQDQPAVDFVVA